MHGLTVRQRQGGDVDDDGAVDVGVLVAAAADGDEGAWGEIVHRYSPMLTRVISGFRLSGAEQDDVAQTVWLRLVEHLGALREPRALPGWIMTTARNEALRAVRQLGRTRPEDLNDEFWSSRLTTSDEHDAELERVERHVALLEGFACLSVREQQLLRLLVTDPPIPYAEISRRTGIPIGSIGPGRARALMRLRRSPAVSALFEDAVPEGARRRPT
jgi:RNA polymerase sigma factor (sigma-70 family)